MMATSREVNHFLSIKAFHTQWLKPVNPQNPLGEGKGGEGGEKEKKHYQRYC